MALKEFCEFQSAGLECRVKMNCARSMAQKVKSRALLRATWRLSLNPLHSLNGSDFVVEPVHCATFSVNDELCAFPCFEFLFASVRVFH